MAPRSPTRRTSGVAAPLAPLPGFASAPPAVTGAPRQASLDDLGTPLAQVTFCVLDLETTGTSPGGDAITEIGALKLRGGECLGRFETLVNPGVPIPPTITVLTGITEAMVLPSPRIEEVLPSFLEFMGDAVIVGHNVRFDVSFLDAALDRHGYPRLAQRRVDTMALARRLVRDEVPNLRLATLAAHLRASQQPSHRAYADAAATAEVLHALLERAASWGVLGLDDLLALPGIRAHPSAAKLALTTRLPRATGVYLFRDRDGRVLYVGKAANLRARVRSYFSGDDRRKVPQLLRETAGIDHLVCRDPLEAAVREVRLIQQYLPRFNRQAKAWRQYRYLQLTSERFARLVVTRTARADGGRSGQYLGPFASTRAAQLVKEAIETAVPLRRCTARIGRRAVLTGTPCVPAQLGVATCPCSGQVDDAEYGNLVDLVRRGTSAEPHLLLTPLEDRMQRLAASERFEEAAATRDRLAALARALRRDRVVTALRATARLVLLAPEGRVELRHGRLCLDGGPGAFDLRDLEESDPPAPGLPARDEIDELLVVTRWLDETAGRLRIAEAAGTFASTLPAVPSYDPVRAARSVRASPAGPAVPAGSAGSASSEVSPSGRPA